MKTELLTVLKRRPAQLIKKAKRDGTVLITKRGNPAAYLIGAKRFQRMQRRINTLETLSKDACKGTI